MRIAFIGTRGVPATYSGFETCVEEVGSRMAQRGHEVVVYCRTHHYERRQATHKGMRLKYLPALPEKHFETLTHTFLSSALLKRHTAVVCLGVGNAPVVKSLEVRGRTVVVNVDGADWQRAKWGRFARWYLRTCEQMSVSGRSLLIADAATVQRYYAGTYGRRTELIPYGATPPSNRGTAVLSRYHLAGDDYALFVGRLVPENGAHDFLAGLSRARSPIPAVVVGSASYEGAYIGELQRAATPTTVFTGYQFGASYQQLTSHARLFVMAATVGGTHPVLLEQMAAGNCVVARDTASHREVLGDCGLYWTTIEELASLLDQLWRDPERRHTLGRAARARVLAAYDWEAITTSYLALCERSLAG